MTIHHATIKRAAGLGFTLRSEDDTCIGVINGTDIELTNDEPKLVIVGLTLANRFRADYPAMIVSIEQDADTGTVFHVSDPENTLGEWTIDSDLDAVFADALIAAQDDDMDPTKANPEDADPEDEEPETTGNVVAKRYKDEYKARGNPNNCGDWLAQRLEAAFTRPVVDGKKKAEFNVELFTICLQLNGVAFTGKWAALPESGQPGWKGRYRMNGRQALEKRVALTGILHLRADDEPLPVPADELAELRAKHPGLDYEEAKQAE